LPEKLAMATHSRLLCGSVSDEEKSLKTLTPGGGADPAQTGFIAGFSTRFTLPFFENLGACNKKKCF
jgi:hypothetical protein